MGTAGNVRACLPLICALVAWTFPCAIKAEPGEHNLNGMVAIEQDGKRVVGVEDVVVYFRPDEVEVPVPDDAPSVMTTEDKSFAPRTLAITVGSSVQFPNNDPILHNVFSSSVGNRFDLGLYGEGAGSMATFDTPGLVRVFCNVHQSMVGHILVLDTTHFGYADGRGSFDLANVPAVPGTLYAWHDRASRPAQLRVVPPATDIELNLKLTARKVPNHKNKHGKSYRRDRRRRY